MAVITIARQVASLGDEIALAAAQRLGYTFIDRKKIESRIIELGFPEDKIKRYDERKPGFFASLVKDRDEYLNFLQYAVLEAASSNNCILIGRGSFVILDDIANHVALRFVSKDDVRVERLKNEWTWDERKAQQRIYESDVNRSGFHKSFFNLDNEDPQHFLLTLNTGLLSLDESVDVIENLVKTYVNPLKEKDGQKRISQMLEGQKLVNKLLFEYKLSINFLRAIIDGNTIILQGVADSQAIAEKAIQITNNLMPEFDVHSSISLVQDFKTYQ